MGREMQVFNFSAGPSMMPVEVPGLLGAFFFRFVWFFADILYLALLRDVHFHETMCETSDEVMKIFRIQLREA